MEGQEGLIFFYDEEKQIEYATIYDLNRTDITAVVELIAVERLHEGLKRRNHWDKYHPEWPGYEPSDYPRAYRVDRKEHIDNIIRMFDLYCDVIS